MVERSYRCEGCGMIDLTKSQNHKCPQTDEAKDSALPPGCVAIKIKAEHSIGGDEICCEWYKCPECAGDWIHDEMNFCPTCGGKIEFDL